VLIGTASLFVEPPPLVVRSCSCSPSLVGLLSSSFDDFDAFRLASSKFNKYVEDDDEDMTMSFGAEGDLPVYVVFLSCYAGCCD
jgi:hypothetical protein